MPFTWQTVRKLSSLSFWVFFPFLDTLLLEQCQSEWVAWSAHSTDVLGLPFAFLLFPGSHVFPLLDFPLLLQWYTFSRGSWERASRSKILRFSTLQNVFIHIASRLAIEFWFCHFPSVFQALLPGPLAFIVSVERFNAIMISNPAFMLCFFLFSLCKCENHLFLRCSEMSIC